MNEENSLVSCYPLNVDELAKLAIADRAIVETEKLDRVHAIARSCVLSNLWINFRTDDYAGISKSTIASQKLKMDFKDFTSKCAYIISQLDPKKSAKVKDDKILLQVRKTHLKMEKHHNPLLICLSFYGLVAHVTNSKFKEFMKYPVLTPLDDGWVQGNGYDNKNIFNAVLDCDLVRKYQISKLFINGILTESKNSFEQYFDDGQSDVPSFTANFDMNSIPMCKWESSEPLNAKLRYTTKRSVDGEMFMNMCEIVEVTPRKRKKEKNKKRAQSEVNTLDGSSSSSNNSFIRNDIQKRAKVGEKKTHEDHSVQEEVKSDEQQQVQNNINNMHNFEDMTENEGIFDSTSIDNEIFQLSDDVLQNIFA